MPKPTILVVGGAGYIRSHRVLDQLLAAPLRKYQGHHCVSLGLAPERSRLVKLG